MHFCDSIIPCQILIARENDTCRKDHGQTRFAFLKSIKKLIRMSDSQHILIEREVTGVRRGDGYYTLEALMHRAQCQYAMLYGWRIMT
jgi:hypothetical protein